MRQFIQHWSFWLLSAVRLSLIFFIAANVAIGLLRALRKRETNGASVWTTKWRSTAKKSETAEKPLGDWRKRPAFLPSIFLIISFSLAAYWFGYHRGFVAGVKEVHSWTTTYNDVGVVWQDPNDPMHYGFRIKNGVYRQHICREGDPAFYPSFEVGEVLKTLTVENKGNCWSLSTANTGWEYRIISNGGLQ